MVLALVVIRPLVQLGKRHCQDTAPLYQSYWPFSAPHAWRLRTTFLFYFWWPKIWDMWSDSRIFDIWTGLAAWILWLSSIPFAHLLHILLSTSLQLLACLPTPASGPD